MRYTSKLFLDFYLDNYLDSFRLYIVFFFNQNISLINVK